MSVEGDTYERLPCGCVLGEQPSTDPADPRPMFVFIPHALDCEYYLYVLEESARQHKNVITVDAR